MTKHNLAALALVGISTGLALTGCQNKENQYGHAMGSSEKLNGEMHNFYDSLSIDAQKKFMELNAKHRVMAMEMVHQECSGKNACKGLGGCKTTSNSCAGMNSCEGRGGEPIKDPNKAVDAQFQNQMKQKGNSQ